MSESTDISIENGRDDTPRHFIFSQISDESYTAALQQVRDDPMCFPSIRETPDRSLLACTSKDCGSGVD
ncbi:hypothetical protein RRG08_026874 [Elysia crispata]|uniref:Uncharacterized protein n=1 Tax=Elysia crispata TaxID=231223 RepID=A0AAE1CSW4_9GAST|nr:hypothetical protein RRG08_026874 [Elysia crispata]